jgi:hypothetical protein
MCELRERNKDGLFYSKFRNPKRGKIVGFIQRGLLKTGWNTDRTNSAVMRPPLPCPHNDLFDMIQRDGTKPVLRRKGYWGSYLFSVFPVLALPYRKYAAQAPSEGYHGCAKRMVLGAKGSKCRTFSAVS